MQLRNFNQSLDLITCANMHHFYINNLSPLSHKQFTMESFMIRKKKSLSNPYRTLCGKLPLISEDRKIEDTVHIE